jgi:hypothetical protein
MEEEKTTAVKQSETCEVYLVPAGTTSSKESVSQFDGMGIVTYNKSIPQSNYNSTHSRKLVIS